MTLLSCLSIVLAAIALVTGWGLLRLREWVFAVLYGLVAWLLIFVAALLS